MIQRRTCGLVSRLIESNSGRGSRYVFEASEFADSSPFHKLDIVDQVGSLETSTKGLSRVTELISERSPEMSHCRSVGAEQGVISCVLLDVELRRANR